MHKLTATNPELSAIQKLLRDGIAEKVAMTSALSVYMTEQSEEKSVQNAENSPLVVSPNLREIRIVGREARSPYDDDLPLQGASNRLNKFVPHNHLAALWGRWNGEGKTD